MRFNEHLEAEGPLVFEHACLLRCCGSVCAWSWTAAHDPQRTYRAIARAHEAYTFFATNATRTVSFQSVGNL